MWAIPSPKDGLWEGRCWNVLILKDAYVLILSVFGLALFFRFACNRFTTVCSRCRLAFNLLVSSSVSPSVCLSFSSATTSSLSHACCKAECALSEIPWHVCGLDHSVVVS